MTACRLSLSLPWGTSTALLLRDTSRHRLVKRIARCIQAFAAAHQVSPLAVDYETQWRAA